MEYNLFTKHFLFNDIIRDACCQMSIHVQVLHQLKYNIDLCTSKFKIRLLNRYYNCIAHYIRFIEQDFATLSSVVRKVDIGNIGVASS